MKTFKRASLPEALTYNGEKYTLNATITGAMHASNTHPSKVIEALKSTGKKGVLVEVLQTRLKGVKDFHGNNYKPTSWIFTNNKEANK